MGESLLSIKTLGTCTVEQEGQPIKFKTRKSLALFIFLVTEAYFSPGIRHPRSKLAELLWPGIPLKSALENLRQALYQLKQVWPGTDKDNYPIRSDRQYLWVHAPPNAWTFDVENRINQLGHEQGSNPQFSPAEEWHFLAYFFLPENEAFENWVTQKRTQIQSTVVQQLEQVILQNWTQPQGEHRNLNLVKTLLVWEPGHEQGNQWYQALQAKAEPAFDQPKQTKEPENKIEQWRVKRWQTFGAVSLLLIFLVLMTLGRFLFPSQESADGVSDDRPKAIAVLPFACTNPDSNYQYLTLGITDDLITSLARYSNWTVKPRTSILPYRKTTLSPQQIAAELSVQYLIEGRVKVYENQLHLDVKLIDVQENPKVVWASIFEDQISNVLQLQANLTDKIAQSITNRKPDGKKLFRKTIHPQAYAEYLKGRTAYFKATPGDLEMALTHFQRAAEIDPDYEEARLHYAITLTSLCSWWGEGRRHIAVEYPTIDQHLQVADRRPDLASEIQKTYGWANLWRGKPKAAVKQLEQAVAINPNTEFALAGLALAYVYVGKFDQAIKMGRKAQELDPAFGHHYMVEAEALTVSGRYAEAHQRLNTALQYWPDYRVAKVRKAWTYMAEEKPALAVQILDTLYQQSDQPPYYVLGFLTAALIQHGNLDRGVRLIQQMQTTFEAGANGYAFYLALAYVLLEDQEQALLWVGKALERKEPDCNWFRVDPLFDPLRSHEQFRALITY